MNRKQRRAMKFNKGRRAVLNKEQRYRDLLGRIDGGVRKAQMVEELEQLRRAFMESYGNAERQDSFLKKHETELEEAKKAEPNTEFASREAIISAIREKAALTWLAVEHLADEVERLEGRIREIDEAGLPKAASPASPDDPPAGG